MSKLFLIVLSSVMFLGGCQYSNYTYIQTPLNVPNLQKRGDVQADLYISVKGVDLQTSYAVSNHLAVMVNANNNQFIFNQDPRYRVNAFALDMAAGYFNRKNKNTFSLYGGVGMGDLINHSSSDGVPFSIDYSKWDNSSHYQKIFIQSSITRQVNDFFNISFALRVSGLHYDSYAYKHASYTGHDERHLEESIDTVEISRPATALVIDPAMIINVMTHKRFSFYGQIGLVGGIGFGALTERKTYDFTGYQSSNNYTTSSSQASYVSQPVVFPISFYVGMRFRICR
ncbi:MAG: hypothetical protein H7282_00035 [Cytophagaceae bacterium]|nr:hypothetical protein [Cytophagaceae bacterium]